MSLAHRTLNDANVESIRVTGHRSKASVKNYTGQLSSQKKKEISDIYAAATGLSEEASCLSESISSSPSISSSCQKSTNETNNIIQMKDNEKQ